MKRWIANRVAGFLNRRGYAITRPRFHEENPIDLRGLLAEPIQQRKGQFSVLQVGANDGISNDPIHHLVVSRKWRLLAVEPMEGSFNRLVNTYRDNPHVRCVQCAVGATDGQAIMYSIDPQGANGFDDHLSSFSLDVLKKHWRHIPDLSERVTTHAVKSLTLSSLMKENEFTDVDMLQIDTEGFDYEVIKMALHCGLFPEIIAFEWEHLGKQAMWDCRCDLIKYGYKWLITKGDVVAVRSID